MHSSSRYLAKICRGDAHLQRAMRQARRAPVQKLQSGKDHVGSGPWTVHVHSKLVTMIANGDNTMGQASSIRYAMSTSRLMDRGAVNKCRQMLIERSLMWRKNDLQPVLVQVSDSQPPPNGHRSTRAMLLPEYTVQINCHQSLEGCLLAMRTARQFPAIVTLDPLLQTLHPGETVTPGFYGELYQKVTARGGTLLVDSYDTPLRRHGVPRLVDCPGFRDQLRPHVEVISTGSLLHEDNTCILLQGEHGRWLNTAGDLEPKCFTQNVADQGLAFASLIRQVAFEFSDTITEVHGTGFQLCLCLAPDKVPAKLLHTLLLQRGLATTWGRSNTLWIEPWLQSSNQQCQVIALLLKDALLSLER